MKAYWMDEENQIYAANSEEEAIAIYTADSGEAPDKDFVRELTDEELDRERPDYDEDERPTGKMTTIRHWLEEATEPGYIAGGAW